MKTVSAEEMRRLDEKAIREYGIPSLLLMENAGRGVAEAIQSAFGSGLSISVFCGKGNNGGDGFVCARHLYNRGFAVQVLLFAESQELKEDAKLNFDILNKMRLPLFRNPKDIPFLIQSSEVLVDALFGVGLRRELSGIFREAVEAINSAGKKVVSIDVPSGLDSDSGRVLGAAVKADRTFTLALPKRGFYVGDGPAHAGEIHVIDIGIPRDLL